MERFFEGTPTNKDDREIISIFYKMFYSEHSKDEEKAIRRIIREGVTPAPNIKINLVCYYKPNKTASLIMKNNTEIRVKTT